MVRTSHLAIVGDENNCVITYKDGHGKPAMFRVNKHNDFKPQGFPNWNMTHAKDDRPPLKFIMPNGGKVKIHFMRTTAADIPNDPAITIFDSVFALHALPMDQRGFALCKAGWFGEFFKNFDVEDDSSSSSSDDDETPEAVVAVAVDAVVDAAGAANAVVTANHMWGQAAVTEEPDTDEMPLADDDEESIFDEEPEPEPEPKAKKPAAKTAKKPAAKKRKTSK